MAELDYLAILKRDVQAWNRWRQEIAGQDFKAVDLLGARLSVMELDGADLRGANLRHANLHDTFLTDANLNGADLRDANLNGADLSDANLNGADLRGATLRDATLGNAKLSGAILSGADLSSAHLNGANFTRADLSDANLRDAELNGAHFNDATLIGADLSDTDLSGASLNGADLGGINLASANLTGATLCGAILSSANLCGANLRDADLSYSRFYATNLSDVDLCHVKGLDKVRHLGPSFVGIDTIYKSEGKIPHIFLRGAGVPDNFITYMASLVGTGIEFYSLFISYSTRDQRFADRLYADLQVKGVRCWFAPHDLDGGKKLHEQIDVAIRAYDKLLLILSAASMASEWVRTEISKARKREVKEDKRVLFPIRLCSFETLRDWECFDADAGKDSAREIREYYIPDFSEWETDNEGYLAEFDKLLRSLKGNKAPDSPK
jgi:uncharacterized protein YjbI with pentapeptide repeats